MTSVGGSLSQYTRRHSYPPPSPERAPTSQPVVPGSEQLVPVEFIGISMPSTLYHRNLVTAERDAARFPAGTVPSHIPLLNARLAKLFSQSVAIENSLERHRHTPDRAFVDSARAEILAESRRIRSKSILLEHIAFFKSRASVATLNTQVYHILVRDITAMLWKEYDYTYDCNAPFHRI
ncbi:hypothetical protein EDD21DRAFT_415517 [Dissophora ornata]|nr:hypothetical protein EDD21DRAFT_415517 [Dissophora ornata]